MNTRFSSPSINSVTTLAKLPVKSEIQKKPAVPLVKKAPMKVESLVVPQKQQEPDEYQVLVSNFEKEVLPTAPSFPKSVLLSKNTLQEVYWYKVRMAMLHTYINGLEEKIVEMQKSFETRISNMECMMECQNKTIKQEPQDVEDTDQQEDNSELYDMTNLSQDY